MKKKNRIIKFFHKRKRAKKKKKNLLLFFKFKKKKKNKSRKKKDQKLTSLTLFLFSAIIFGLIFQIIILSVNLIQLEAFESSQKIKLESENIKRFMLLEIENDFKANLNKSQWADIESKKELAEKIRYLDYLNSHLSKMIEAYQQDFSLQIFRKKLGEMEKMFQEVQNLQLISSRIANKVDTLLLFDKIDENQKELLEKDFDLFYEKTRLVKSFSF